MVPVVWEDQVGVDSGGAGVQLPKFHIIFYRLQTPPKCSDTAETVLSMVHAFKAPHSVAMIIREHSFIRIG